MTTSSAQQSIKFSGVLSSSPVISSVSALKNVWKPEGFGQPLQPTQSNTYYLSKGISVSRPDNWCVNTSYSNSGNRSTQTDLNNHNNQVNSNNPEYGHSKESGKKSK